MARKPRDYKKEYRATQGTAKGKKDRAARNKARRQAMKAGKVRKGDGKHVDHKDYNPRNNGKGNTRVVSARTNLKRQPKRNGRKRA